MGWNKNNKRKGNRFNKDQHQHIPQNINKKQFSSRSNENKLREPVEKLLEVDVGITEYMSNLEGFIGIIKARFSDFHVNEIGLDGNVSKLTSLESPQMELTVATTEEEKDIVKQELLEKVSNDIWDKIQKLVDTTDINETVSIDVTSMTKVERTNIYAALDKLFGSKVIGVTKALDDKKFINIKLHHKGNKVNNRIKWQENEDYVHFLLYKECTDTLQASLKISQCLGMSSKIFQYAGVKDRRAKTTQWFSVRKVHPSRLSKCTKHLSDIKIGNFCFRPEPLKLGQLKGNRFRLAIRNVNASKDLIEKAINFVKDNGFINYYGLQRFGNCKAVPTYEIGLCLLKGNYKEAVDLILKPRQTEENKQVAKAKQIFNSTHDPKAAYEVFNRKDCIEKLLFQGMVKNSPNDFVNSLANIPRNMRLMYIHSFQSLIWNKIVSKRIKELGLKPIVGDLVYEGQLEENVDIHNDDLLKNDSAKINIKILTEEDLDKYTIYDVVLPLPGYDIIYPKNIVKNWYEEMLKLEGLSLEMPQQRVKTYTLSGAYRKMLQKATNFSWKMMGYNDHLDNLILSDYDELCGKSEPQDVPDGKYKAVVMDFELSSSCYATMVVREIMKMDTSVQTHMNLEKSNKDAEDKIEASKIKNSKQEIKDTSTSSVDPVDVQKSEEKHDTDSVNSATQKRQLDEEIESTCKKVKTIVKQGDLEKEKIETITESE